MGDPFVVKSMVTHQISRIELKLCTDNELCQVKNTKNLQKFTFSKPPPNRWSYPDNKICIKITPNNPKNQEPGCSC